MLKPIKHATVHDDLSTDPGIKLELASLKSIEESKFSEPIEMPALALDLLLLVKNELRDKDGNINRRTEQKLADAFRTSSNPRALANAITALGKFEHIKLIYEHAILFFSCQNEKGFAYQGVGTLFAYNRSLLQSKRLGINGKQLKPLANTIREATTLEGNCTRLNLAHMGVRADEQLMKKEKFMNFTFAKTGDPQRLVNKLNEQIARQEQPGNRHELFYVNELDIRIDYTRPPRVASARTLPNSRLQIVDAEKTFFCTISLK